MAVEIGEVRGNEAEARVLQRMADALRSEPQTMFNKERGQIIPEAFARAVYVMVLEMRMAMDEENGNAARE